MRRKSKDCKYIDIGHSHSPYCSHPHSIKLFCDGVCNLYEEYKNKEGQMRGFILLAKEQGGDR